MTSSVPFLDRLVSLGRTLGRRLALSPRPEESAEVAAWLLAADEARRAGRRDEALGLYRRVLRQPGTHPVALRCFRDTALEGGNHQDALWAQQRLVAQAGPGAREEESATLASLHHESGRSEQERGHAAEAMGHWRSALRADRGFVPAALTLGDALAKAGDPREAVRTWERAVEASPALPLLTRLERAYREEGRPTRMIGLYQAALARAPDDLALAVALGRVYLELEMLDEAADQLEKVEVRAPTLPAVHAYLGTVFEHRGDLAQACEEYRRALRLGQTFEWPHRCACGAITAAWQEQCPMCRRWNALRPIQG